MTQEEGPLEIEIGDSGTQPNLLPGVPSGWTDALTGTDGPRLWDRTVSSEVARVSRYRRPVTVALIEINGLDRYARSWGIDVAERLFVQLARTMAVNVRSSDHMARLERTRFGLLLTETDEIAAINYVERVREAGPRSMPRGGENLRFSFGWASPKVGEAPESVVRRADTRLMAELLR